MIGRNVVNDSGNVVYTDRFFYLINYWASIRKWVYSEMAKGISDNRTCVYHYRYNFIFFMCDCFATNKLNEYK